MKKRSLPTYEPQQRRRNQNLIPLAKRYMTINIKRDKGVTDCKIKRNRNSEFTVVAINNKKRRIPENQVFG